MRTRAESFQGLGREGFDILMEAKAVYEEFRRDSDADINSLLNDSEQQ
jgi:hypothetical protein